MAGFLFGGNTPWTYDELQRKRAMAETLAASMGTPKNVGEGLTAIGKALAIRGIGKKASAEEKRMQDEFQQKWGSVFSGGGMSGGTGEAYAPGPALAAADPMDPKSIAADTMKAIGKGATPEGIKAGLVARGMPEHIAEGFVMNFQDESGLNPGINEVAPIVPGSRGGFGLAQWTGPRRKQLEAFAAQKGMPVSDPDVQMDFLMAELQGPESAAWSKISGAKNPGEAGAAIVNHFLRPAAEHRARREAEYLGGGGMDVGALVGLASDPMASPEQKAIIGQLIQQQMTPPDPMAGIELEKAQLELDQMRNPQPEPVEYDTFNGPDGAVYRFNPATGQAEPITGAKPQEPGYRFLTTEEVAANPKLDPNKAWQVGPDGRVTEVGGGGVTVNTGEPSDGALRKKLSEKEGESWATYMDSGTVSAGTMQDMQLLDELITMAPQGPVTGRLASAIPGVNSAADAFTSVVKRVAPTLRAPGSGATSDIEYDGMLKSLPQLSSRPEANAAISAMMKAKAQINIERGQTVSAYQNGQISAGEAREKINEINTRSIMTPELKSILGGLGPAPEQDAGPVPDGIDPADWEYMSPEDRALFQ